MYIKNRQSTNTSKTSATMHKRKPKIPGDGLCSDCGKVTYYTCMKCMERFRFRKNLKLHICLPRRHSLAPQKVPYGCAYCDFMDKSKKRVLVHLCSAHSPINVRSNVGKRKASKSPVAKKGTQKQARKQDKIAKGAKGTKPGLVQKGRKANQRRVEESKSKTLFNSKNDNYDDEIKPSTQKIKDIVEKVDSKVSFNKRRSPPNKDIIVGTFPPKKRKGRVANEGKVPVKHNCAAKGKESGTTNSSALEFFTQAGRYTRLSKVKYDTLLTQKNRTKMQMKNYNQKSFSISNGDTETKIEVDPFKCGKAVKRKRGRPRKNWNPIPSEQTGEIHDKQNGSHETEKEIKEKSLSRIMSKTSPNEGTCGDVSVIGTEGRVKLEHCANVMDEEEECTQAKVSVLRRLVSCYVKVQRLDMTDDLYINQNRTSGVPSTETIFDQTNRESKLDENIDQKPDFLPPSSSSKSSTNPHTINESIKTTVKGNHSSIENQKQINQGLSVQSTKLACHSVCLEDSVRSQKASTLLHEAKKDYVDTTHDPITPELHEGDEIWEDLTLESGDENDDINSVDGL